jgi:hypothetical protein
MERTEQKSRMVEKSCRARDWGPQVLHEPANLLESTEKYLGGDRLKQLIDT